MLRKNTSKHKQKFLQGNTHFQIIKRVRTFLEYFCNIFSKLKLKYLLVCVQMSLTDSPVAKGNTTYYDEICRQYKPETKNTQVLHFSRNVKI